MRRILIVVMFFSSIITFASGGSVYSRFGLGDLTHYYLTKRFGLGGGGISVGESRYLSVINPASWYKLDMTRFETGVGFSTVAASDNLNSSDYSQTNFPGFFLGFPVERDLGISLVFGIVPYSNVNYDVFSNVYNPILDTEVKSVFGGEGSITKAFIGASYKLPFDFVLGASYEYYAGKLEYNTSVSFNSDVSYNSFSFNKKLNLNGMGGTVGLISGDISKILNWETLKEFRLGAAFSFTGALKTDTSQTARSIIGGNIFNYGSVDIEIPYKMILGTSVLINERYHLMIDYMYQPWSRYEFNNIKSENLRDLSRFSLGVEYSNPTKRHTSFWEQIILRGGLSFEQTQYKINGEGIDQMALHLGVGLPMSSTSTIDIGIMAGIKGTKDNNLLQEKFIQTMISINFGDLWFLRPER